jgi:NDP-sugar pyrophosphorylase family protein
MSDQPIQAVLMCGGLGTRLRPWSYVIPKPMFPIGERPILELLLERLRKHRITEIYLSLGYKAEVIEAYFRDGAQFGVSLRYVREEMPLGTAGALNLLREQLHGPFLMMNGDLVTRLNFRNLYAFHCERQAALTVATKLYEVQVPYGVVDSDEHTNAVTELREKPKYSVNINAGIYLISPATLDLLPAAGRYDATQLIEAAVAAGRPVYSYPIHEYWMDIGRFEDYDKANADAKDWIEQDQDNGGGADGEKA